MLKSIRSCKNISVLRHAQMHNENRFLDTFRGHNIRPKISMLKRQHIFIMADYASKTSTISLGVKILTFNVVGKTTLK